MSRLPIRLRVTLAYAAVMAALLLAVGVFLYVELGARLEESVDNGLRTRAGEVAALVRTSQAGLEGSARGSLIESEEAFAQVLGADGEVRDSTPQLGDLPVIDPEEAGRVATGGAAFLNRASIPGVEGEARLLATPVAGATGELVVVVGSSLDDRDEAQASLATLLLIGGPIALLVTAGAGYLASGSALRPVEAMRARAAEISGGQPGARLPVPRADDEIARLAVTLNAMLARLDAALERERRFVDDASHELRTPLALHKTELEVALRYGTDERELRAAIASAIEEVDRLIRLAEDLLVVARAGEGELPLAREEVPVAGLFATLAERFRSQADRAGRKLAVSDPGDLRVRGDRVRLEQALTGLLDNALRHGAGTIALAAGRGERGVELHVRDRGVGFPPTFLDRAFERFSRADRARGRGGAGLGLAIVDTIARAHGGRTGAGNQPGGGADVWIELPEA